MPFDVDFTVSLAGGLLRAAESLCEASPFLVCGLIVAATFRRLVGHAGVRTLFGDGTRTGLLRAWAVGMLLPVDALGVLPVAREMRRAGLRGGTILAFALSAPLFNPLSLLYGLTLSDPAAVLAFGFGSLLVVTGAGFAWDRLFPETAEAEDPPPAPVAVGIKRLIAVAVAGGREAAGGTVPLVLAALVGPFLLGAVLPKGVLGTAVNGGNPLAPLLTTAVAIPAYASPMAAMGTVGSMFQHGNSVGAAFAMLALGAGTTFGLIIWAWRSYGPLRAAVMFAAIVAVTLGLSYGIDRPLRADGADEGGHTHAFDRYTAPFSAKAAPNALWTATWNELEPQIHETFALIALAATVAFGVAVRLLGGRLGLDDWLAGDGATEDEVRAGRYDIVLPPSVLGGATLCGLGGLSILLCYAYYPTPNECFEQLKITQADALTAANTGNRELAEELIPVCADWAKRAQVGYALRSGSPGEFRELRTQLYLDRLEELEHEISHQAAHPEMNRADQRRRRRVLSGRIGRSASRMRAAYSANLGPG